MKREFIDWQRVYETLHLPDGRKAWAVAQELGVEETTFKSRLRHMSLERAVFEPVKKRRTGEERRFREAYWQGVFKERFDKRLHALATLDDGRSAWSVAKSRGVSPGAFKTRLKRGWTPQQAIRRPWGRRWQIQFADLVSDAGLQ